VISGRLVCHGSNLGVVEENTEDSEDGEGGEGGEDGPDETIRRINFKTRSADREAYRWALS